jgi:hypothetical protein
LSTRGTMPLASRCPVRKQVLCHFDSYIKVIIYQDRLGTSTGKLKKGGCLCRAARNLCETGAGKGEANRACPDGE